MLQIYTCINEAWGQTFTPLKTKRRYALNQYIHLNQVFRLILIFATAFILKFLWWYGVILKHSLLHKGRFFVTEILKKQPLSCAALVASRMFLLLIVIMGRITILRVFSLQKRRGAGSDLVLNRFSQMVYASTCKLEMLWQLRECLIIDLEIHLNYCMMHPYRRYH